MSCQQIDRQNLEMAIQTVLFRNQARLQQLSPIENVDFLKEMAREITEQAITFQAISSNIMNEMERIHYDI